MADHLATPWEASLCDDGQWMVHTVGDIVCMSHSITKDISGYDEANAAFIVKAANSHDALKASLAEMVGIYWGDGDGHEPPPACIQRAMAVLASIEVQP